MKVTQFKHHPSHFLLACFINLKEKSEKKFKKSWGKIGDYKTGEEITFFWHFENKTANCLHLARNKMLV